MGAGEVATCQTVNYSGDQTTGMYSVYIAHLQISLVHPLQNGRLPVLEVQNHLAKESIGPGKPAYVETLAPG